MDCFSYKNSSLFCEDVNLQDIANEYGTPAYVYSRRTLEQNIDLYQQSFKNKNSLICFSVKSLNNLAILKILNDKECGFDIVSYGELMRVLHVGADPNKIIFSGVGKSEMEIVEGINNEILSFNIESESELYRIESIASKLKKQVSVAIRFNPEIDSGGHDYITTGRKGDKFGISSENFVLKLCDFINDSSNLNLIGLACHIGSQILDIENYRLTARAIINLAEKINKTGTELEFLDLGGGLGITYIDDIVPSATNLISLFEDEFKDRDERIILEPGRSISGNAGVLLTKVEYIKNDFLIVDAAMNDLLRPSLYKAKHDVWNVSQTQNEEKNWTIVGPVCESSDVIIKDHKIHASENDFLAIKTAGAYGFVMSSNYNSRMRCAEVLVNGNKHHEIRKRESFGDLIKNEIINND